MASNTIIVVYFDLSPTVTPLPTSFLTTDLFDTVAAKSSAEFSIFQDIYARGRSVRA